MCNCRFSKGCTTQIATKSKAKIVVCTLWGTKEIPKNLFRRRSDVYFDVLDVIDTEDNQHTTELGERIYDIMSEKMKTLKQ